MDDETSPVVGQKTLTYLKWLVTALTVTMILGIATIVGLLVIRSSSSGEIAFPREIILPEGVRATAFTQGEGWYAVVTDADQILIYDQVTGGLLQQVTIVKQ